MSGRRVRLVLAMAVGAATGIALPASPALAACAQAPAPGVPIPDGAPRDPLLDRLDLDRSWLFTSGEGVTVGVVDTGVDAGHPKLSGAVDAGSTVTPQQAPADATLTTGGGEDCQGHGTAVAGIIAGREQADDDRVAGIAPGARLWPVRLDGEISQLPPQAIAQGIVDAADHATVINLSFARPADDPAIRAAVEYAVSRDVVVVAAAGNESSAGGHGQAWYPAAYDGVLAVTAVDAEGAPLDESNAGDWVDIAAPGSELTVPARGGGYLSVTGTSFAAAVVSGVAALVRARFPSLTAAEVGARITSTAVPPGSGPTDVRVGSGVVDPYAALTYSPDGLPAAAGPSVTAGAVRLGETISGPAPDDPRLGTALRWAGVLLLAAVAALVAGVATRAGLRRRWRAGADPPAEPAPTPTPSTVDLV